MKKVISIAELCRMTGKSRSTIWRWQKSGNLPALRQFGPNSVGYLWSDIECWLESKRFTPESNLT